MPFFGAGSRLFQGSGARFLVAQRRSTCDDAAQPSIPRLTVLFLHSRTARLRAPADRRQRADRRDDTAAGAPRRVPRPRRRAFGVSLFRGHAGRYLAAPAIIRRGGHIRAFTAFVSLSVVSVVLMPVFPWPCLADFSHAVGLRFRGPLRGNRSLDQRQGDQRQSRGALRPLSNRQFQRLRDRPDGPQPLGPGGFSAFAVAAALLALAIVPIAMTASTRPPSREASALCSCGSFARPRSHALLSRRRGRETAPRSRWAPSSPSRSECRPTGRLCSPRRWWSDRRSASFRSA